MTRNMLTLTRTSRVRLATGESIIIMLCCLKPQSELARDHHQDSAIEITIRKQGQGHLRAGERPSNIQGAQEINLGPDLHLIEEKIDPPTEAIPTDLKPPIILLITTPIIATEKEIPRKIKIAMVIELHIAETLITTLTTVMKQCFITTIS